MEFEGGESTMAAGYWILVGLVVAVVVLMRVRGRQAERRMGELKRGNERMKEVYRTKDGELQRYKEICRQLLNSNEELRSQLAEIKHAPQPVNLAERDAEACSEAKHLRMGQTRLSYREGLVSRADFSHEALVQDLKAKCEECDVEATLHCFDSGIRMSFVCEAVEDAPALRVILRVPEGGSCCIYEEGKSDPESDWPPVKACLDTMFSRGREVYLSYSFSGRLDEAC